MDQDTGHNGSKPKLLVVDDEEKLCALLMAYFARKAYEVRVVQSGEEAVAMAELFHPNVVLLDLLMPGMDGIETLKRLKTLPGACRVIMLSAADAQEVVDGALQLGADFYVCKPVNLAELERLVNGFLPPHTRHPSM